MNNALEAVGFDAHCKRRNQTVRCWLGSLEKVAKTTAMRPRHTHAMYSLSFRV